MTTVEFRLGEKNLRHAGPGNAGYEGEWLTFFLLFLVVFLTYMINVTGHLEH